MRDNYGTWSYEFYHIDSGEIDYSSLREMPATVHCPLWSRERNVQVLALQAHRSHWLRQRYGKKGAACSTEDLVHEDRNL